MVIIASIIGGMFTVLAVILAWILAKKSFNKYQQKRDENNLRVQLMVEFNNLTDQVNRMLISFKNFERPFSGRDSFDFASFQNRIDENMFDFLTSKTMLINKLRIRIPDISEEKLEKLDDTFDILFSIYKESMERIDKKVRINLDKQKE